MTLCYNNEISSIESCPLSNDNSNITLYRLIKNHITCEEDLEPKAINPRNRHLKHICEAWGISTYKDANMAIANYKGMNSVLRSRFSHLASVSVDISFGIKYQSGENSHHYSLFPFVDENIISKFTTVSKL